MTQITGNTSGLKPSQLKAIENLSRRRLPPFEMFTVALAQALLTAAEDTGREIGILLDRKGRVVKTIVGTNLKLDIPEMDWAERGRLSGLRLVHAHPSCDYLRDDDITNLLINRFDSAVVFAREHKHAPVRLQYAVIDTYERAKISEITNLHGFTIDFPALIESLETRLGSSEKVRRIYGKNQAICIVVAKTRDRAERRTSELKDLASTAGLLIEEVFVQIRPKVDPQTLIGSGKLQEIFTQARRLDVDMLVFDPELTPVQAKNISEITDLKIIDRTLLILDIFATRARSREGKLQVELAQLKYTLPRLVGKNTMLSRLMGGGVGGRGPGETKLEIDRRRAKERIDRLEKQIETISAQRSLRRLKRTDSGIPVVAIVGYTNAGKSTLLKTITGADVLVEDRLFATLDPRTRRVRFPENLELIFTDTVGFIEDLPTELRKAFRATLEEIHNSSLLIHLVDLSDPEHDFKLREVNNILDEMNLSNKPLITVFNKIDAVPAIPPPSPDCFFISAKERRTMEPLIRYIADFFQVKSVIPAQSFDLTEDSEEITDV